MIPSEGMKMKDEDIGHHCKKRDFTCFRMIGDKDLTLDAPKNIQITVLACPFCGEKY